MEIIFPYISDSTINKPTVHLFKIANDILKRELLQINYQEEKKIFKKLLLSSTDWKLMNKIGIKWENLNRTVNTPFTKIMSQFVLISPLSEDTLKNKHLLIKISKFS
jgi:hypothetical protein